MLSKIVYSQNQLYNAYLKMIYILPYFEENIKISENNNVVFCEYNPLVMSGWPKISNFHLISKIPHLHLTQKKLPIQCSLLYHLYKYNMHCHEINIYLTHCKPPLIQSFEIYGILHLINPIQSRLSFLKIAHGAEATPTVHFAFSKCTCFQHMTFL